VRKSNTSTVEGDCGRSEERAKLAELWLWHETGTTQDEVEVEPRRGTRRRDEFSCSRCLNFSFRVSCMRMPNQNACIRTPTESLLT